MKLWLVVIGFVVGATVGVAAGFALGDPAGSEAMESEASAAVPASCLEAISAARNRLLLNPDVTETLRDYRDLGDRITDDAGRLRLPDLRGSLAEFNDLNERASELLELATSSRFSEAANECEESAAQTR